VAEGSLSRSVSVNPPQFSATKRRSFRGLWRGWRGHQLLPGSALSLDEDVALGVREVLEKLETSCMRELFPMRSL